MNEFEKYPELANCLQEYASHGRFNDWQQFTNVLNKTLRSLSETPSQVDSEEEISKLFGEVTEKDLIAAGEMLGRKKDSEGVEELAIKKYPILDEDSYNEKTFYRDYPRYVSTQELNRICFMEGYKAAKGNTEGEKPDPRDNPFNAHDDADYQDGL